MKMEEEERKKKMEEEEEMMILDHIFYINSVYEFIVKLQIPY